MRFLLIYKLAHKKKLSLIELKMNISLVKNNDRYDIEIRSLMEIIQKIKSVKGNKSCPKTRKYSIPRSEKKHLLELLQPIANIEIIDNPENQAIHLDVELIDDRVYVLVENYFKVPKVQLEQLFVLFRSIFDKKYDGETHKWNFPQEEETNLKDGLLNLINAKGFLIKCGFFNLD